MTTATPKPVKAAPLRLFDADEMYTDDAMVLDADAANALLALVVRYKAAGYSLKDIESVLHDTVSRLIGLELLATGLREATHESKVEKSLGTGV